MKKLNIAKKFLIQEYITNHKPVNKIAKEFGYGETTIFRYLNKYKIKIRPISEYTKVRMSNPKMNPSYIDGRTNKKYLCKGGCGKEVSADTYLYNGGCCKKCGALRGEKSPHFIDGRSLKEYKCSQCGKEINWQTALYGSGLCVSCVRKGERSNRYIDGRSSKKYYCIEKGCSNEISYGNWRRGKKRCAACAVKELWKDKDRQLKFLFSYLKLKPNKPETLLGNMLNVLFPKEYKFVGDGKVILGGFCPDFINCNGSKKIIEFNGQFWHTKDQYVIDKDKRKLAMYKSLGYKTLVIWEHELSNLEKVKNRIIQFNNK